MADRAFTELRSERLVVRRFRPDDLAAFVAYRADPGIARYQGWGDGYTLEQGEAFLEWVRGADPDTPGEWFQFAVERNDLPGLIGDCAARFDSDEVEVGFTLARGHHGRGYATEAVGALLGYLASRGHARAVAWCDVQNLPSRRVLERLGFELQETVDGEHRFTRRLTFPGE